MSRGKHNRSAGKRAPIVLVVDVGGTHIKIASSQHRLRRQLPSGDDFTPSRTLAAVGELAADWDYDVVTIGYPGVVLRGRITHEPDNLGKGWVGFNFGRAMGRPVKIVNDAAMQALGSYRGRRMLFLGLGTGLGSAIIIDGVLAPTELAHLPYQKGRTYEQYLGIKGMKRMGKKKWRAHVWDVVDRLRAALEVDYVVLGGGNARLLKKVSAGIFLGSNDDAIRGGIRLWQPPPGRD